MESEDKIEKQENHIRDVEEDSPQPLSAEEIQLLHLKIDEHYRELETFQKEKDWNNIVEVYADILTFKTKISPEADNLEFAELYLKYGNALLQNATLNSDIFGSNTVKKQAENALPKEEPQIKVPKKAIYFDDDLEKSDNEEEANPLEDLELAWEVLNQACTIFSRENNTAKVAEAKYLMGCVDMEGGDMNLAKEEFLESFKLREKVLGECDPLITDSLTLLGLMLLNLNQFKESKHYFEHAETLLQKQLQNPESESRKNEIESQLSEVKSRIRELETNPDEYERTKQIVKEQILQTFFGGSEPQRDLTAPVADLGIFSSQKPEASAKEGKEEANPEKIQNNNNKAEEPPKPRRITPLNQTNGDRRITPLLNNSTPLPVSQDSQTSRRIELNNNKDQKLIQEPENAFNGVRRISPNAVDDLVLKKNKSE